jgi:hypothetical protein
MLAALSEKLPLEAEKVSRRGLLATRESKDGKACRLLVSFLKKTDEDLRVARETAQAKARKDADAKRRLLEMVTTVSEQLTPKMKAITSNLQADGKHFTSNAEMSILLGEASVTLFIRNGDQMKCRSVKPCTKHGSKTIVLLR